MARIGAHFHVDHPLNEAIACGADAAQFFLGDPQGWKGPVIPGGDPAAVRDAFAAAGVDIYIHAPYVINVATSNNRIRIPSRKILDQQLKAAASVGAKGLIVHGGHVTAGVAAEDGLENWRKAVERIERPLPMLIENTAGGDGAMARSLDAIGRLWDAVTEAAGRGDASDGATSASAWIPVTPTRRASTSPTRPTGSRPSPAGSTWCTATTRGMSSARAGTGTPTSAPGPSIPPCCSAWSAPRAHRSSARPPTRTAG